MFVYRHKGKKNQCFGIDTQVYLNEAHEKVKNLKIYAFLKVKKRQFLVFVYIHRGQKNQFFRIDTQVYLNEAHEKVKKQKFMAFLWKCFDYILCVATNCLGATVIQNSEFRNLLGKTKLLYMVSVNVNNMNDFVK